MIFWAIFTIGFISGGILTAFVLTPSREKEEVIAANYPMFSVDNNNQEPDKIFEQLTRINYPRSVHNSPEPSLTNQSVLAS